MQLLAAEVKIAVLEAHILALIGLFVRHVDGRNARGGLHHQLVRFNLDLACRKLGIDGIGRTELHLARHGDHGFEMCLLDKTEETAARVHHDLREAVVVAEINEKDAAVIAEAEHPPRKTDRLARVRGAEFVARMGTVRMHSFIFLLEKLEYYTTFTSA